MADRLGLTATGLTTAGWQPRHLRAWLDRVRDRQLTPAESVATLRMVYRVWLVALLLKAAGSGWDAAIVHFSLPVSTWVYPVWITAAVMLMLVAARYSVRWVWTATTLALT